MHNLNEFYFSDAREYLRTLREDNVRSSDDVVDIYDAFIRDCNGSDLGDERWMILEQVVVAAFDTHRTDIVDDCLKELSTMFDFSSSLRMKRLFAMKYEMYEEFDEAMEILNSIIDEDDSNSQARKRKIAILKVSTGKSLSEALIFASTNPQYDDRLFIELQVQYMKIPSSKLGRTLCV